ncbi:hypothetical protein AB7C87_16840 [Natrarchaeobius sp. A-rgal3]|uniref:hypothetical protein n=1 Tax=Natrarchaeobius versutus TaxID=1679078 RepID=UPI00350F2D04
MTEEHDYDVMGDVSSDDEPPVTADGAAESVRSTVTEGVNTGAIPLASGGVLVLSALRSALRGQLRAIPKGLVGVALVRHGVRRRRSTGRTEELDDGDGVSGERWESEPSSEAAAASERPDSGREGRLEPSDDDEPEESRIEFVDDGDISEPRSRPGAGDEEPHDPRRTVDDGPVEIDVSDSATADEAGEATGPDPEQAQPARTEATEPETTPEEDSSERSVDHDETDAADSSGGSGVVDEGPEDDVAGGQASTDGVSNREPTGDRSDAEASGDDESGSNDDGS